MEVVYVGISKRKSESTLVSGVVVVSALIATLAGCGDNAPSSDAASTTKPSTTASASAGSPKPVSPSPEEPVTQEPEKTVTPEPKKVTLSLAEIADTPGTFEQFEEFVAKHGTAEQKKAVKHLKGWRGYERKLAYPALEASSDYPTVDYEAIDGGDEAELDKMLDLEEQSQYIAEALAAWWEIDETAVFQVYDRSGEDAAGTACIRPDSVENEGSCI
jgi:formylglycine-generating enzyme required for sulfatase activity